MCKYFLYSCNCLWVTQCHVCILLKERIFFSSCVSSTQFFFLNLVCVFLFIPTLFIFSPKLFFPKLVLFFLFLQGEKFFFNLCGSQGELLFFIGGVVSILLQSYIVYCSLDSLFSLILYCVCLLFIELSLSIRDKNGEK